MLCSCLVYPLLFLILCSIPCFINDLFVTDVFKADSPKNHPDSSIQDDEVTEVNVDIEGSDRDGGDVANEAEEKAPSRVSKNSNALPTAAAFLSAYY